MLKKSKITDCVLEKKKVLLLNSWIFFCFGEEEEEDFIFVK